MRGWIVLLCAMGCSSGEAESEDKGSDGSFDITSTDDIADICNDAEPLAVTLSVEFPATSPDCPWDTADNLSESQAYFTARIEQTAELALPDGVVVCDMDYDFLLSGGEGTPMVYDDHFYFTFDGVLLATSYGPAVTDGWLEEEGDLPLYDWDSIAGREFQYDVVPSWCLGQDDGSSDCDIPPTETEGILSLDFGTNIVEQLSLRAVQEERFEFGFVTTGDNDPNEDCAHADFEFQVEVGYVRAR